ncbi:hypothetical protein [Amycolatopsis thermoflava]|uniref:hypothetical protein n=1 Tax=Amycolatopsis thermoflava TaxID=84480 RepID=UPI000422DD52|nr:hypothetical protein [Amycolatopsis thermoflava]
MLWICQECTTAYAVGLLACPHCASTNYLEEGQEMPKITVYGGASNANPETTVEVPGEVVDGPHGEREPLPEFDPTTERVTPPVEQEATGEQASEGAEPFDPSDHTVTEVLAYLDGADDVERTRVLDAEKAGKNRRGIVGEQA